MWLITYSQSFNGPAIIANTHSHANENPAQWLSRMYEKHPNVKTILLFAVEVPEEDARKI